METLIVWMFWMAIISGVFALLGLAAEGCEWFADAMDAWGESVASNYADDGRD